jgi:hypothetical protein
MPREPISSAAGDADVHGSLRVSIDEMAAAQDRTYALLHELAKRVNLVCKPSPAPADAGKADNTHPANICPVAVKVVACRTRAEVMEQAIREILDRLDI